LWDKSLLAGKVVAQIDHDPNQLEKVFNADIAIEGDIRQVLSGLMAEIEARDLQRSSGDEIRAQVASIRDSENTDYALFHSGFSLIEQFFIHLERHFPRDTVLFDDNIIFAQNFFNVSEDNRYYPNSGISSLGHAIPAAIGARFADDKSVFAILGDGGFQMCCMEIMTAVNYAKPLNVVMFNNASMGLIRKNQYQHYQERYINCDFSNPDFELLARSFGIAHKRIAMPADLDDLFAHYDLKNAINLIEIMIDKHVFPNYSSKR
jgi:acetolactate synthase-1/2/3 large subunit